MSFQEAVRTVFSKYATFSGRARRSEYWWFALFAFLVYVVAFVIDEAIGTPVLTWVVALALVVPSIAVSVRRLHDTDRTGWWYLLGLVPFGGIVLIVFYCLDSTPAGNRYGPPPKAVTPGYGYGAA